MTDLLLCLMINNGDYDWFVDFPYATHFALSIIWGILIALVDLASLVYQGLVQLLSNSIAPLLQLSYFSATHLVNGGLCNAQFLLPSPSPSVTSLPWITLY